ncbi:hypothetical protein [Candidatus Amarolinea aalborgensis]|uniref:hypothetical protein n=1 Tax=Candidatus Amarolinea aalborgensis TaxID=2249329 RepID=UPI003BF9A0DE
MLYNQDPTDQSFALICANCTLRPDFTLTAMPASRPCAPASAIYTLTIGAILGYNQPVSLSATGGLPGHDRV